jgi:predicted nucleic acid-binding protein
MSGGPSEPQSGRGPYVIDTSVALKWYVPEDLRAEAVRYLGPGVDRHAPDYLHAEAGGALLKRVRSTRDPTRHLPLADAQAVQSALAAAPVQFHPSTPLNAPALALALEVGCSHYDGLFLALAIRLGGQVVTADRPFHDKVKASPHADNVRWVGDGPQDEAFGPEDSPRAVEQPSTTVFPTSEELLTYLREYTDDIEDVVIPIGSGIIRATGPDGHRIVRHNVGAVIRLCSGRTVLIGREDAAMLINDGVLQRMKIKCVLDPLDSSAGTP